MTKQYTEQEIRDFYEKMHTKDSDNCYNIHIPTWNTMIRQSPKLCIDLEVKYQMRKVLGLDEPPPTTEYVKKREGIDLITYIKMLFFRRYSLK